MRRGLLEVVKLLGLLVGFWLVVGVLYALNEWVLPRSPLLSFGLGLVVALVFVTWEQRHDRW